MARQHDVATSGRRARCCPGCSSAARATCCSTASAAGLLAQLGAIGYTATKHAAVAVAEWLSMTYGDRGIRVSCLCAEAVEGGHALQSCTGG